MKSFIKAYINTNQTRKFSNEQRILMIRTLTVLKFCSCFVVLVPQILGSPRFNLASYSGNLVTQLN